AGVDPDHLRAALRDQVLPERAAAVELDGEAAEVAELLLPHGEQRALLASQEARVRPARRHAAGARAPAACGPPVERPHAGSVGAALAGATSAGPAGRRA